MEGGQGKKEFNTICIIWNFTITMSSYDGCVIYNKQKCQKKVSSAYIFRGKGEIAGLPRQGFKHLLRGDSVSNDVGIEMWVRNGPCPPRASPLGRETGHEYMKRFSKFKCLFVPSMEFTGGKSTVDGVDSKGLKEETVAELDHEDKTRFA